MIFEIEQYLLHTERYRVQANSEADAIARVYQGEADPIDNSLDFIEVADKYGMPANQNRTLVDQLHKLGIATDTIIPSIRTIEKVE
jgi:type III secretion system FlhB-like substrate exporter